MWTALTILVLGTATATAADTAELDRGDRPADDRAVEIHGDRVVAVDAARAPRSAAMVGASCTFRTSNMARRVVAEGEDYVYMGTLLVADDRQADAVACPYRIGTEDGACVVATELVEHLEEQGLVSQELSLEGRSLELDGLRYVVLTAYTPGS